MIEPRERGAMEQSTSGFDMFLAQVGLSSGPKFSATVAETGFLFLGMGAAILATLVLRA